MDHRTTADRAAWPPLPLADWKPTLDTLHMWTQIVGKTRLALSPWENHWWHVALYVGTRGLVTSPIPYRGRAFEVGFDFVEHALDVTTSDGARQRRALQPQSVAEFYAQYVATLRALDITVDMWPVPSEVDAPIPFADDRQHASYDRDAAHRFFQALLNAARICHRFKGRFLGKTSPVHFFWGAFDLALTRFSGRRAPALDPSVWSVMREAMSHEEMSVGFWPGSGAVPEPAFYAYVRPEPPALASAPVRPAEARYDRALRDFILPYDAVRSLASPDDVVLDFFQSVYDAGADLAGWDRDALDRPRSEWA